MSLVNKDEVLKLIRARNPCLDDPKAKFEARWIVGNAEIEVHAAASRLCKNCKECVNNGKSINR